MRGFSLRLGSFRFTVREDLLTVVFNPDGGRTPVFSAYTGRKTTTVAVCRPLADGRDVLELHLRERFVLRGVVTLTRERLGHETARKVKLCLQDLFGLVNRLIRGGKTGIISVSPSGFRTTLRPERVSFVTVRGLPGFALRLADGKIVRTREIPLRKLVEVAMIPDDLNLVEGIVFAYHDGELTVVSVEEIDTGALKKAGLKGSYMVGTNGVASTNRAVALVLRRFYEPGLAKDGFVVV